MRAPRAGQRGVALLIALLAMALAVLLAAALLDQGEAQRARLRDALRAEQSWQLMGGLEAWATHALATAAGPALDTLDDPWLQPMPPIDIPGARIRGQLRDLGGCFDLNRLAPQGVADPQAIAGFERLLQAVQLDPRIAREAADWIDADLAPLPGGAEDSAHAGQRPARRTGNRPLADVSEIKRLPSVDAAAYARLEGLVCALPRLQPLNLNTAPPAVWMSLDPRIDEPMARRLARGPGSAYASMQAVAEALLREGVAGVDLEGTGLATGYYIAEGRIQADGIEFLYSSLIERDRGQRRAVVVARTRGRL